MEDFPPIALINPPWKADRHSLDTCRLTRNFGTVFSLLINVTGLNLTSFALLGGAVGMGLRYRLQKIAGNFSGVILLLKGQTTEGQYAKLSGDDSRYTVKRRARHGILQTFHRRWILAPMEDFITTRAVKSSDAEAPNWPKMDLAVGFSVNGRDDRANRESSEVREWTGKALKEPGIKISFPHPVAEIKGALLR